MRGWPLGSTCLGALRDGFLVLPCALPESDVDASALMSPPPRILRPVISGWARIYMPRRSNGKHSTLADHVADYTSDFDVLLKVKTLMLLHSLPFFD